MECSLKLARLAWQSMKRQVIQVDYKYNRRACIPMGSMGLPQPPGPRDWRAAPWRQAGGQRAPLPLGRARDADPPRRVEVERGTPHSLS
ncbi:hypothetical protein KIN20_037260 [Parelaphostrongylus tenuis]|uniref:Uncharacterized protein n=1 Tax=Parelaphostrongylus tenuis TaxID=148309 RepID=A0AAD5RE15_PARTN|nr:hypothetical protein KIN20_037260 [Parelaphostrongylus tenuis]